MFIVGCFVSLIENWTEKAALFKYKYKFKFKYTLNNAGLFWQLK